MAKIDLEKRLAELELEVATLRKRLDQISSSEPWWERIAGTFQGDPVYQKAMKLGRQYRRTQKPNGLSSTGS
jgi:hypothetical protein